MYVTHSLIMIYLQANFFYKFVIKSEKGVLVLHLKRGIWLFVLLQLQPQIWLFCSDWSANFLIFGREKLTVLIMCLRPEGTRGSSNYLIMCC